MPLDRLTQITSSGISSNSTITVSAISGIVTATSATISGNLTVSAGSTSAPSISPSGDSNTGIFFPSADTVAIGEGGTEVIRVNSSGNVGIGTVSPVQKIDIVTGVGDGTQNETNAIRLRHSSVSGNTMTLQMGVNNVGGGSGGGGNGQGYSYLQSVYWGGGNNTIALNPKGGGIAIGSNYAGASLDVRGDALFKVTGTNTQLSKIGFNGAGTYTAFPTFVGAFADNGVWSNGMALTFNTIRSGDVSGSTGLERMRISSDGNVGIGTTNPNYPLDVRGIVQSSNKTLENNLTINSGNHSAGVDIECFNNANTVKKAIALNPYGGNVGVGLTNPQAKLDVAGPIKLSRNDSSSEGGQIDFARSTDNATSWSIDVYGNTSTPSLRFFDSVVRMQIDGSGRVTKAYQPAFHANRTSGTESNAGTVNELGYSNAIINVGGHYSVSTFRFTAPVTGTYFFYASTIRGANNFGSTKIRKNQTTQYSFNEFTSYTNNSHHYGICIMDMSAGDYASVQASNYAIDQNDYFGGYLLG